MAIPYACTEGVDGIKAMTNLFLFFFFLRGIIVLAFYFSLLFFFFPARL